MNQDEQNNTETLEESSTVVESSPSSSNGTDSLSPIAMEGGSSVTNEPGVTPTPPKRSFKESFKTKLNRFNLYLAAFAFIVIIVSLGSWAIIRNNASITNDDLKVQRQELTSDSLKDLANSDVTVGDAKQVLTVQSNAIFSGKVLVRDSLEVAGKLLVGTSLSLSGLTVSGQSTFDDIQITRDLSTSGNASILGRMTARNISVNGDGTFNGTVTAARLATNSLTLNGDLVLTRHITAGGATPSRSNGLALGSGGTASVSGSDTAGTLTVNTGGSPAAGCFATINFSGRYNATPKIQVTPVGSAAANVNYYITRSTTNFSICGANPAPVSTTFAFDYFVIE